MFPLQARPCRSLPAPETEAAPKPDSELVRSPRSARGKLGGGMWVFEPSMARWNYTMALINSPCPDSELGTWVHADMDVVNYMFCDIRERESFETWPFTRDLRQGVLPGLRYIPQYRDISEVDYNRLVSFPTRSTATCVHALTRRRARSPQRMRAC